MRESIISFLLLFTVLAANAQGSYYDHIEFGKYYINYCDSIIYDAEIQYDQYGYSGNAPLFVQIWFPSIKSNSESRLNFGDFKFDNVPAELSQVYEKLGAQMNDIFIRDGIEHDIITDEPIDYGKLSTHEILQKIMLFSTRSSRTNIDLKLNYPVIVYHHGSQGLSFENSIMAEYFASHGYVFIAANFHLPYENTIYGLLPYNLEKENKHNQSSAKKLIKFAKSITNQNEVFYIGHSWGAQEGWCFLNDTALVDAFISIETTIEFKTDSIKIKELWPYVYEAIKVKRNTFSIPILLFASSDDNTNFDFFKGLSSEQMIFASFKEPFAHNSYTSMYLMRYFISSEIKQPDSEILLSQIRGYSEHLKIMLAFLESIQKKQKFKQTEFEESFYFK